MRLRIRGKYWNLKYARIKDYGTCDSPHDKGKTITIRTGLTQFEELGTAIHEIIHACNWDACEEAVLETEQALTEALWRMGWRKQDQADC